jgi:hypothetical protein
MFREPSLKPGEGSIRERKPDAQGNEISGPFLAYFLHVRQKVRQYLSQLSSQLRLGR